ncbi:MAG: MotA/TolQ/ExbB proton channel family protein [Bryobacteraceae bacterium]
MATSQAILTQLPETNPSAIDGYRPTRRLDRWMLLGILIAVGATVAGIASTGVGLAYFLQPAGALIVLGGTLGVLFITTPRRALIDTAGRITGVFWDPSVSREHLIDEIVAYAKASRRGGLLSIEPAITQASSPWLQIALRLAVDVKNRTELQLALETELRLRERQGETDARTLEIAGGFAPTIGIIGTVVGLIDVLRQFSNLQTVGSGIGTAFVSTIYGLGLANLVLLPMAHRIRARVAEAFEIQELIVEGVLCLFDGTHPALVRERLQSFLREPPASDPLPFPARGASA